MPFEVNQDKFGNKEKFLDFIEPRVLKFREIEFFFIFLLRFSYFNFLF